MFSSGFANPGREIFPMAAKQGASKQAATKQAASQQRARELVTHGPQLRFHDELVLRLERVVGSWLNVRALPGIRTTLSMTAERPGEERPKAENYRYNAWKAFPEQRNLGIKTVLEIDEHFRVLLDASEGRSANDASAHVVALQREVHDLQSEKSEMLAAYAELQERCERRIDELEKLNQNSLDERLVLIAQLDEVKSLEKNLEKQTSLVERQSEAKAINECQAVETAKMPIPQELILC
jgi:hypothetical protein